MSLKGNDNEKLLELCSKTYKEQIVWFLNAFWDDFGQKEAEHMWKYNLKCVDLDLNKRAEGNALDELNAHVFLEHFKETLTVREMRTKLRETGAIGENDRPKTVPITHYLLFKYNANWHTLVNASQGDNGPAIREAQRKLDEVQKAFAASDAAAQEAKAALAEAKSQEAKAKSQEAQAHADAEAAKVREAELAAAKVELEAALAEVKAQEDAYNAKTADLTKKSEEGGMVSRNKAKNELAQHLGEDPLPLRRAKITAEAAVKKADRARQAAADARSAAEASAVKATEARHAAEAARAASERAAQAAEAALEEARQRLAEAEAYLEEVKNQPGCAHGAIWWMERELHEAKAYLPESKGGYRKGGK